MGASTVSHVQTHIISLDQVKQAHYAHTQESKYFKY